MDLKDRQGLCREAADTLAQTPHHRKLTLIWSAAAGGMGLLSSLFGLLLSTGIAGTGGLAGMGTRSVLSTAQSALMLFTAIAMPFWEIGYNASALQMSRTGQARLDTLPEGFRRFGPVLRFVLLQGLVYFGVGLLCIQFGSILISMTPFARALAEKMMPLVEAMQSGDAAQADPAVLEAVIKAAIPVMVLYAVLMMVLYVPVFYRLRMSVFRLMDEPQCGAVQAMMSSVRMMRGKCVSLFLLDLRFWWFYLAEIAILLLCYADVLLPMAGVSLPMSEQTAAFVCYIGSTAIQVALYTFTRNTVFVTYAKAYDRLRPKTHSKL